MERSSVVAARPRAKRYLLTQNSELRKNGIFNWTLPAYDATLPDGRRVKTCPSAGACAALCYARNGSYLFRAVREAHGRNLAMVLDDLAGWKGAIIAELLGGKRYRGKYVRIHDSGDFFSDAYLGAWLDVARSVPDVTFYAYTKEVARFRRLVVGKAPENFRWLFSMGGLQDATIDREAERHAEVFASNDALVAAGYFNQEENDVLAVTAPTNKVGIVANNIAHFRKRQGNQSFGQIQAAPAATNQPFGFTFET